MRILTIEDDRHIGELLRKGLTEEGHPVAVARRGPVVQGVALSVADLTLDPATRDVTRAGMPLTLTRADAGVAVLQRTSLDLRALLDEMRDGLATLCVQASLDLQIDLPDRPVPISGDRAALTRLVRILVDNAVKYTPAPGRVALSLVAAPDGVVIEVADTGIGISAEDLPRVCDRFFRADKARSRDAGGAGLGLSIATWLADQHGARLTIQSEHGHGCRATVQWPADPAAV